MLFHIVLVIVIPALVVAIVTMLLGRRKSASSGEFDAESLSFFGGVFNAIFVVVLAFYIVFAWQSGDNIETHAEFEANGLIDIDRQAALVPQPDAAAMRTLTRQYASTVVEEEWASLRRGQADPAVSTILGDLRSTVVALPADSQVLSTAREQALHDIRTIDNHHRARVDEAISDDPLITTLLAGVVAGAVLMVVFPMLVGLTKRRNHIAVMVLLAVLLGGTVYASIELTHPVQGLFAAGPDKFRAALEVFAESP